MTQKEIDAVREHLRKASEAVEGWQSTQAIEKELEAERNFGERQTAELKRARDCLHRHGIILLSSESIEEGIEALVKALERRRP